MKTVIVIIILVIAIMVALGLLAVVAARLGQRSYQRYSGLEHQRASARQAREAGAGRLKDAERHLIDAQRDLAARGQYGQAQEIERLRVRLSAMADQLRHATWGYAPLGAPSPVREDELAGLQRRDADTISDARAISDLTRTVRDAARTAGPAPGLTDLHDALDQLGDSLARRKAVN